MSSSLNSLNSSPNLNKFLIHIIWLHLGKMETVCFRLPGHGDTTLKHMNSLRCRQHFCDITIMANNNQTFKGHKVVLAACSPFLRDQFLLNPSPKLQVSRNAGRSASTGRFSLEENASVFHVCTGFNAVQLLSGVRSASVVLHRLPAV